MCYIISMSVQHSLSCGVHIRNIQIQHVLLIYGIFMWFFMHLVDNNFESSFSSYCSLLCASHRFIINLKYIVASQVKWKYKRVCRFFNHCILLLLTFYRVKLLTLLATLLEWCIALEGCKEYMKPFCWHFSSSQLKLFEIIWNCY